MIVQRFISDAIPPDLPHVRLALLQGAGPTGNFDAVLANLATLRRVAGRAKARALTCSAFPSFT